MGQVSLTSALIVIVVFTFVLGLLSQIAPPEYRVLSPIDLTWLGTGIVAVAGACTVATGIPCASALAIFSVGSVLNFFAVQNSLIKTVVFLPLSIILIYIISRLARGG